MRLLLIAAAIEEDTLEDRALELTAELELRLELGNDVEAWLLDLFELCTEL